MATVFSRTALLAAALAVAAAAAQLSGPAQTVLPASTRQVISINYHRLATDAAAQQLEAQLLPGGMADLGALLARGGIIPANDLNRLTFATYQATKGIGLIGIAEGNLSAMDLSKFYTKTKKQPDPPQIDGVNTYTFNGLTFFMADSSTLVFGSREAVTDAIQTEQGGQKIGQNEQLSNMIAGTQSSDVWSVLDAAGSQAMVRSMLGSAGGGMAASLIDQHFNGARYTIAFGDPVQLNLEMMTTDALSAAALSTGLNAAIAIRQKQEKNPQAKALLGQVQVDSAGNHAFLQLSAPASSLDSLLKTDLMQTILSR
ncbi:MAG: hypothetical protein ACRD01_00320 [Terriglobales bacterium]